MEEFMPEEERATEIPEQSDASEETPEAEDMDDAALDNYLEETPEESDSEGAGEETGTVEEETSSPDETGSGEESSSEGEETVPEESEISKLKEQVERLSKQVSDKEEFIQARSREIGSLRKQLREEAQNLRDGIPDLMVDDPVAGVERLLKAREAEARAAGLEAEEVFSGNKAEVLKFCPNFDERVEEIAEIAKSDGVPPEAIREFRNNPYATSPGLIKTLLRRADDSRRIGELEKSLAKEKSERESVASKIAQAAAKTSVIKGKTPADAGGDKGKIKIDESSLDLVSDEELDAFLEREG